MDEVKQLLEHLEKQAQHCKTQSEKEQYKVDKYSKNESMTDEQMSGYYQGRGEANWNMIYKLREILKN